MLTWLFPNVCPTCGAVITPQSVQCADCVRHCPPEPLRLPIKTVGTVRVWCTALYVYRVPIREALHQFKFNRQRSRGAGFGALMSRVFPQDAIDLVTFVPMARDKQRMRGYNQAELLAKACAKGLQRPMKSTLKKVRSTGTQHELNAEARARNAVGAYEAEQLHGERVLLCDDIVTTGATLRACAEALLAAGASEVHCICVAWTKGEL